MCKSRSAFRRAGVVAAMLLTTLPPADADASDIYVPAGGNLQAAINTAVAGDTILLEPGATYIGNFTLPVHAGADYVTIRTAPSAELPPEGGRITPAHAPFLAKIRSSNTTSALRTLSSAAYWRLLLLEFQANVRGSGDLVRLGDGSIAQNGLSKVPHHLIMDRVYMHGDVLHGQKRGVALNSAETAIINSFIVEMKTIGEDSQAIGGWNGPGPFRIENNHLEGAGEVFLMGGDDPKIPNLTPSDLVFRGNTLTRPLSWRQPIVSTPAAVRASVTPDGSLAAGTYAYRVTARRPAGNTTAKSPASAEVAVTVAAGARITVEWDPVPDATEYLVYGRTPGAQDRYWLVATPAFSDDGTKAGTAGTPSSSGTVWQVKNLFELKHMSRALVSYNLMENNWAQAQQGTAILITPRNQGGTCPWCRVEDVTFEYNVVRHTGSGLKILGWDDEHPSQQTVNVTVRHNEFSDVSKAWGGTGYVFILIDGPKRVTFDHNTLISPSGSGVLTIDVGPVEEFTFTNNVARHNSYGIQGGGKGVGNTAIAHYFPGGVVTRNVFAGGKASSYPAGNEFPTLADFERHFVDYARGDFSLVPGTGWAHAGTDGLDLGADVGAIAAREQMAPPRVTTTSLPDTTQFLDYSAALEATGGRSPYTWTVSSGSVPDGLSLDMHTGVLSGTTTLYGDYTFTLQVEDATGAVGTHPMSVHVEQYIPPVQIVTTEIASAIETVPYAHSLEATGGLGMYTWSLAGGTLPEGLVLTAAGVVLGTPASTIQGAHASAAARTYAFTAEAADSADPSRRATRAFVLTVAPPSNKAPVVAITAPADGAVVPVGATITLAAQPFDADGTVQRVDFYVGGAPVGSASAPSFTMTWTVSTAGMHTFTAAAVDDEGAAAASAPVTIGTRSEIVLRAAQVTRMAGNFKLNADATAAGGYSLWNFNKGVPKTMTAVAAPAHYAEFEFYAEAGRPYQLWIRGKAERNEYANDSVHIQFDAVPSAQIGTTGSLVVNLEEAANAGLSGWGWQDNGYGGAMGTPIVFTRTGLQTLRIQNREDGLAIDQIVLSPGQFLTASPGTLKNDTTILPQ